MSHRQTLSLSLFALWIGAALFFAVIVTPALFASYTPEESAKAVGRMLPKLDLLILALTSVAAIAMTRRSVPLLMLVVAIVASSIVSAAWITPAVASLREAAGAPMSTLAKDNPLRQRFGMLHGISSALLLLRILLGAATIVVASRSPRPATGASRDTDR